MKKELLLLISVCALMASCGKDESRGVEYVPFQETEDGQWGMISTSGEILFTEEFKNAPTIVKEGRFMVKNDNGLWEIFTADAKPEKIGEEYAYASCFNNGKAFVSKRNDYIQIIDLNGNTLKKLDKIGNKFIDAVSSFSEGYAVYQTGNYYGALNEDGEEVLKADYVMLYPCSDDKFVGINKKYEKEFEKKKNERKIIYDVLDTKGNKLFEIKSEKYCDVGTRFIDGVLPVAVEKDGKECWGLINDNNEVVVKPAEKIKGISDIKGKKFVYNNGEGYGVMNLEGENEIRAKYDFLYFDAGDRLVAITEKTKNSFNYECKFIDGKDNQIGEDKYVSINPLSQFDGSHSFVKISDRIWSIVDKDGKQVDKLPDIVNINLSFGDNEVLNDHVDFAALFAEMGLSENGIDGLSFNSTPQEAVKKEVECGFASGNDNYPEGSPYWYDYKSTIGYTKEFSKVSAIIIVGFPDNLSRRTYRNETEYFYGYAFSRKVPSGYAFNKITANIFGLTFKNTGKMMGKLDLLLKELKAHFKKNGQVEKENNGAAYIKYNDKNKAIIYMEEDGVTLHMGNLKEANEFDIEQYENNKEKISIDNSVIQTVNGSGIPIRLSPINSEVDTVAIGD